MNSVALSYVATLLLAHTGFRTLDGQFIPGEVGERALQSGAAILVAGLLVGDFSGESASLAVTTIA